ncbi:MAG: type II toxin-antitoxin system death-on-curing family toxin [Actinomycetota bacterium]|nr:type II toxin-antitoxin system death-on-curing family toxin [Actinomycetota bacterium]
MTKIKPLTIEETKYLAHSLAQQFLEWGEPIPTFDSRFPNILESCLAVPLQTFGRKSFYPTLYDKAAMLFYLMIKNHPFENGNKRIAIISLLVFLYKNGYWLEHKPEQLYKIAVFVAESDPKLKDEIVSVFTGFLRRYMVSAE